MAYDQLDSKSKLAVMESCNPFYEFELVKSINSFYVPSKSLFTMTYLKSKRKIVITDYMDKSLKVVDINGKFHEQILQLDKIQKPWAINSNSKNEIFVSDFEENGIIKLDSNFKFNCKIGEKIIRNACYMALDPDNEDVMYITHYIDNKVTVWDTSSNKLISSFEIDSPEYIQIKKNKIYLSSRTEVELVEDSREFKRFKRGSNCIFILNKSNYSLIHAIRINEWLDPRGLVVDENNNILTTAFKLTENNIRSDWRSLYIISERKNCYTAISLVGLKVLSDMLMIENKVYFCISNMLEIIALM